MNQHTLMVVFILSFVSGWAKERVYTYTRDHEGFHLTADDIEIIFSRYKRNEDQILEKVISFDSSKYVFQVKKVKKGRVVEIFGQGAKKMATMLLSTIDAHDIILASGAQLKWSGITNKKWSDSLEGKKVIECSVQKNPSAK